MAKGSSTPTTVQQQSSSEPWGKQQEFLTDVFGKARDLYGANPTMPAYPGSTVAQFSPETNQALGLQTQRALNGSPVMGAANANLLGTLTGQYLDAGNPNFQTMVDRIKSSVMPAVHNQFANAGGPGGLEARAMGQGLGDAIGALAYQNYGDERNRQMQANLFAPQAAMSDYQDIAQLGQVGAAKENLAQQSINDLVQKYNQGQMGPWQALGLYAGNVSGNYGGTTTGTSTTTTPGANPWSQGLGALLGGVGLMGQTGGFGPAGYMTKLLGL